MHTRTAMTPYWEDRLVYIDPWLQHLLKRLALGAAPFKTTFLVIDWFTHVLILYVDEINANTQGKTLTTKTAI